jgi:hypothetical protein
VSPFVGERVINHSKDVLEETYDLWDYFDEKRDALERLENYLLRLRDIEGVAPPATQNTRLGLLAVLRAGRGRLGTCLLRALHASLRAASVQDGTGDRFRPKQSLAIGIRMPKADAHKLQAHDPYRRDCSARETYCQGPVLLDFRNSMIFLRTAASLVPL